MKQIAVVDVNARRPWKLGWFLACWTITASILALRCGAEVNDSPFLVSPGSQYYWTDSNCCGIASAYVVANNLGVAVSLDDVASDMPVTAEGTSMKELSSWFDKHGLSAIGMASDTAELVRVLRANPKIRAIAHWRPAHWVAVFGADSETFDIFQYPRRGTVRIDRFGDRFDGQFLLVGQRADVDVALKGRSFIATLAENWPLIVLVVCSVAALGFRWRKPLTCASLNSNQTSVKHLSEG
jgi:hypothetical protein